MCLSTYYLQYGRHLSRPHRRRRAYAPTSNTASHDKHEKINSWVWGSACWPFGPPELRYQIGGFSLKLFRLSKSIRQQCDFLRAKPRVD